MQAPRQAAGVALQDREAWQRTWRTRWLAPDREWLYQQGVTQEKSIKRIADQIGASSVTVWRWFELLEVQPSGKRSSSRTGGAPERQANGYYWNPPSREWLVHHYVTQDKTEAVIAGEVEASRPTVRSWLRDAGIPLRPGHVRPVQRCASRGSLASQARTRSRRRLESLGVPKKCSYCGKEQNFLQPLDAHHIDGNPFNEKPENLQYLCTPCHFAGRQGLPRGD